VRAGGEMEPMASYGGGQSFEPAAASKRRA
jgi:hypothetical protein